MANRVIWLPTGSRSKSSSRIQVYNIHDKLVSLGYDSQLLYEPRHTIWSLPVNEKLISKLNFGREDLVIIQKIKAKSTSGHIRKIKSTGAKVAFIDCDEPIAPALGKLADFVVVPSTFLQKRYEAHGIKCHYIPDCPETYISPSDQKNPESVALKCVWFGNHSKSKWKEVIYFKKLLKERTITNWRFETISNTAKANHRWNKNSFNLLTTYDLVVIPVPKMTLDYKIKSANRLLQSMALGLPVLSSPVPSYIDIVASNKLDHIICNSEEEWIEGLGRYEDSEKRKTAIDRNYEVARSYSLDHIIKDWVTAFDLKKAEKRPLDGDVLHRISKKSNKHHLAIKYLYH